MHVLLGGAHYVRVTQTRTRGRQVAFYEKAGATVRVEVVTDEQVPAPTKVRLGALVRIDDGGEPRVPLPKRRS